MDDNRTSKPKGPTGSGTAVVLFGVGAAVLAVVCCAGPALLAAGAVAAVGAWLASPWVIGAAVALLAGAVLWTVRRRVSAPAGSDSADCCNDPDRLHQPDPAQATQEDR